MNSEILDRLPPSSVEDERGVIAAVAVDPRCLDAVAHIIEPVDFYTDAHKRLFRAFLAMQAARRPIDLILTRGWLTETGELDAVGGVGCLAELFHLEPWSKNAEYYARNVARYSRMRKLILVATDMLRSAYDPAETVDSVIGAVESALYQIKTGDYRTDPVSLEAATVEAMDFVDEVLRSRKSGGVQTGLDMLDYETGGVYPGELTVLAARTAQGKTTLALQIAHNMATAGIPVYYASLEMNRVQIALKNVCRLAGIPIKAVRSGRLFARGRGQLVDAQGSASIPLYIHDWTKIRPFDIARAARRLKAQAIFVDYLQRVKPTDDRQKRWEQVGQISDDLKTVAADLKIPVIALAQLNREVDREKRECRPKLSQLRESGNLEQDADQVWLLWRPENGIDGKDKTPTAGQHWGAELKVAKHRFGDVQTIRLDCDARETSFRCYDQPPKIEKTESELFDGESNF